MIFELIDRSVVQNSTISLNWTFVCTQAWQQCSIDMCTSYAGCSCNVTLCATSTTTSSDQSTGVNVAGAANGNAESMRIVVIASSVGGAVMISAAAALMVYFRRRRTIHNTAAKEALPAFSPMALQTDMHQWLQDLSVIKTTKFDPNTSITEIKFTQRTDYDATHI